MDWSQPPSAWNATDHWTHPSHHSNPLSLPHASCCKQSQKQGRVKGNYQKQRVWLIKVQPADHFSGTSFSTEKTQHLEASVPKQTSLCFSSALLLLLRFLQRRWLHGFITTCTPAKVPEKAQLASKKPITAHSDIMAWTSTQFGKQSQVPSQNRLLSQTTKA